MAQALEEDGGGVQVAHSAAPREEGWAGGSEAQPAEVPGVLPAAVSLEYE